MINVRLEKRLSNDPRSAYWLKLNGIVDREIFQLPAAIESNTILNKMVEAHAQKLVIDLSAVKDFDSRGVQMLVMLYRQFSEQNMPIVLQNPGPYLSRVLRIMQLDRLFEVVSDKK
jgi:anti-anti-sigma factor